MNRNDEHYFARHALGAGSDFEWADPYVDGYDYDDDAVLPFDDEIVPGSDDGPIDDDFLFEEE